MTSDGLDCREGWSLQVSGDPGFSGWPWSLVVIGVSMTGHLTWIVNKIIRLTKYMSKMKYGNQQTTNNTATVSNIFTTFTFFLNITKLLLLAQESLFSLLYDIMNIIIFP
jgi:hypothetical protein